MKGAILESSGGVPLTINTGTLTYSDIRDYDKTSSISASVNVSFNLGSFDWQKPAPTATSAAPVITRPQQQPAQQAGAQPAQYTTAAPGVLVAWPTDSTGQPVAAYGAGNSIDGMPAIWTGMTWQPSTWASALQQPVSYASAAPAVLSPAPVAEPSMLAQLGMYVNKAAQYMGKYPTTFQLSYKSSDTERWTYATIGAGSHQYPRSGQAGWASQVRRYGDAYLAQPRFD